jgi:hypothetical protein
MSKSDFFENALLKLIFNAVAIANVADNAAASPLTNLYVSLHTADPGDSGSQTTNEIAYTGYARVAVARTTGGWTVTTNSVSPFATIAFPAGTGGSGTAMFFAVGTASSGAGNLLYSGVIGSNQGAFTAATSGTFTAPGHTMIVDDRVGFFSLPGTTLPTGITEGTVYWIKTVSGDTFTIASTQGGTAITISASGDGVVYKDVGIVCGSGITPQIGTGTTIVED